MKIINKTNETWKIGDIVIDNDDEKALKEDWELGAASDYMPVSDKYREWLQDPILHDIRRVAVMVGFIYA